MYVIQQNWLLTMPHGAIPYPFGDCLVCGDKATGVHYGVATCEGCKVYLANHLPGWLSAPVIRFQYCF